MRSLAADVASAKKRMTPAIAPGFNAAPSFFRPNIDRADAGPAKAAEHAAAANRLAIFNRALHSLRSATDALYRLKAMDRTGQLVAGIEHFDVHVTRTDEATEALLGMAASFAKEWDL